MPVADMFQISTFRLNENDICQLSAMLNIQACKVNKWVTIVICVVILKKYMSYIHFEQPVLHQGHYMIHNKIHLIIPVCTRLNKALQVQSRGLKIQFI